MINPYEHDDYDGLDPPEERPATCFHPDCQKFLNDVPGEYRWVGDRLYCREHGDQRAALDAAHQREMDEFNKRRR